MLRRVLAGAIDRVLNQRNLARRVAFITPHMMVLPFEIASSDLAESLKEICQTLGIGKMTYYRYIHQTNES